MDPNQVSFTDLERYISEMGNNMFLNETQVSALHNLLLLNKPEPWEPTVLPTAAGLEKYLAELIKTKMQAVRKIVDGTVLKAYKQVLKIPHIKRVLKAKRKSFYIQHINITSNYWAIEGNDLKADVVDLLDSVATLCTLKGRWTWELLEFSRVQKYVMYRIGSRFLITIVDEDPEPEDSSPGFSLIPQEILTHHLLTYLNLKDLLHCRMVCKAWHHNVRLVWPRCLLQQVTTKLTLAAFCDQVDLTCQLMRIRSLIADKIHAFVGAVVEIIDWELLREMIERDQMRPVLKAAVVVLLAIAGKGVQPAITVSEGDWQMVQDRAGEIGVIVKMFVSSYVSPICHSQLNKIKQQVLDHPLFRYSQLSTQDKTPVLTLILSKLLPLQLSLKQNISLAHSYILLCKNLMTQMARHRINPKFLQRAEQIMRQDLIASPNFDMRKFLRSIVYTDTEFEVPELKLEKGDVETQIYIGEAVKSLYHTVVNWRDLDLNRLLRDRNKEPQFTVVD